jgi:hypothetical protein
MQKLEEHEVNRWISLAIKGLPLAICRKSWVFSGCSSFLPQGKLTGSVRINTCSWESNHNCCKDKQSRVSNISKRNTWCNRSLKSPNMGSELNNVIIDRFRLRTWTSKTTWKWRVVPMYGYATPFWRHFHVVFDVRVLDLNLSNIM